MTLGALFISPLGKGKLSRSFSQRVLAPVGCLRFIPFEKGETIANFRVGVCWPLRLSQICEVAVEICICPRGRVLGLCAVRRLAWHPASRKIVPRLWGTCLAWKNFAHRLGLPEAWQVRFVKAFRHPWSPTVLGPVDSARALLGHPTLTGRERFPGLWGLVGACWPTPGFSRWCVLGLALTFGDGCFLGLCESQRTGLLTPPS